MIYTVTRIEALHGHRDELLAALRRHMAYVRTEPGCIHCEIGTRIPTPILVQQHFDQDTLTVFAQWKSLDYLLAHRATAQCRASIDKMRRLVVHVATRVLEPATFSETETGDGN